MMKHTLKAVLVAAIALTLGALLPAGASADSPYYNRGQVCNQSTVRIQVLVDVHNGVGWQNKWVSKGECVGRNNGDDAEGVWGKECWITWRNGDQIYFSCKAEVYKIPGLQTANVNNSWYDGSNPISSMRTHLRASAGSMWDGWKANGWPAPDLLNMAYTLD